MVERYGRDDREQRVEHVRRIEPAAQARLHHGHVYGLLGKVRKRECGADLELRWRTVHGRDAGSQGTNPFDQGAERLVGEMGSSLMRMRSLYRCR